MSWNVVLVSDTFARMDSGTRHRRHDPRARCFRESGCGPWSVSNLWLRV